jgi:hypothetical protein
MMRKKRENDGNYHPQILRTAHGKSLKKPI